MLLLISLNCPRLLPVLHLLAENWTVIVKATAPSIHEHSLASYAIVNLEILAENISILGVIDMLTNINFGDWRFTENC